METKEQRVIWSAILNNLLSDERGSSVSSRFNVVHHSGDRNWVRAYLQVV